MSTDSLNYITHHYYFLIFKPIFSYIPSSMPLSIWLSSSSVYSHWCSFQLSPVSLRRITSSLSFPLRAAKCGISTITGLKSYMKMVSLKKKILQFGNWRITSTIIVLMTSLLYITWLYKNWKTSYTQVKLKI